MKYIATILFSCLMLIGSAQQRRDTTTPPHGGMPYPDPMQPIPKINDTVLPSFHDMVFLMQQNMELSQRLDRLEKTIDSLSYYLSLQGVLISHANKVGVALAKQIDSIEQHPVIYIDNLQKELWVKCPDGSCDIFIRKL